MDNWYREWFNEDYMVTYSHRDLKSSEAEVDFLMSVLRPDPGECVLDLCCGNGRHSLALCGRGLDNIVALDLSPVLIGEAARLFQGCDSAPYLVRADMVSLPFPAGRFDVVANFFTSFGYFLSESDNRQTLSEMARILRPGGRLWFDYINAAFVRAHLEEASEKTVGEMKIQEFRSLTHRGTRLQKIIHIQAEGEERVYRESVRLYEIGELEILMRSFGLEVSECFGGYDGRPFSRDTPRLILVASCQDT